MTSDSARRPGIELANLPRRLASRTILYPDTRRPYGEIVRPPMVGLPPPSILRAAIAPRVSEGLEPTLVRDNRDGGPGGGR